MSIMEKIFGVRSAQAAAPQNPATPTNNLQTSPNQQTAQSQQTAPNGVVPEDANAGKGNKTPGGEESPLKHFETLWQPVDPKESNATPPENQFTTEKFMEAAGKVDFTKVISQEDLQKIAAGGQDAVQAFATALNKTAQTVFGQSTAVAQKLSERAVQQARDELLAQIPGIIRKQTAGDSLLNENPAFQNPALAPVISALQQQFSEKFPKASSSEINKMTKDYLTGAASIINPPAKPGAAKDAKAEDDWLEWMK